MSDFSARLGLPLLPPTPVQPHVTHNEALIQLESQVHVCVLDRDLAAPPGSPAEGDAYLVDAAATGAWSGKDGLLAFAVADGWRFLTPFTGLAIYVADEERLLLFDGSRWRNQAALLELDNLSGIGINTGADSTNRLAVKSAALLFDNDGHGIQAKLNKHAVGDTAALLYQTAYSGRAEIGLCGDDRLHVKVSADGSSFVEAMVIEPSGRILLNGQTAAYAVTNNNTASTPTLQLAGLGTDASILFARFATGAGPARFTFAKSRGTVRGDFTAVADSDILGQFSYNGSDGTGFVEAAWVRAMADGAASSGMLAGKLAFGCTPSGGTIPTDWLTIRQNGNVWIGSGAGVTPACKLDVDGPVRVKSYAVAALPSAAAGAGPAALPSAAAGAGQMIYVSDESGGAVIAFSDGTNWRRVTDRAVVS